MVLGDERACASRPRVSIAIRGAAVIPVVTLKQACDFKQAWKAAQFVEVVLLVQELRFRSRCAESHETRAQAPGQQG